MEMPVAHFPIYRTSYGAPLILDHPSYYQQQQQPEPYTNYGGYFYPRNPNEKEYTGYFGRTNVYGIESDNLNTRFGNEYLRQADDYYQQPQYFYRNEYVVPQPPQPPAPPAQPPVFHYYNSPSLLESKVYQYQNVNPPRRYIINPDHYKSPMTFPHTGYEKPQKKTTEKPSIHDLGLNTDCTLGKTKLQDQIQLLSLLKSDDKIEMTTTITPMTTTDSIRTIKPDDIGVSSEKNEETVTEEIKAGDDDDNSTEKVTEISTEIVSTTEETRENQQEQESIEE